MAKRFYSENIISLEGYTYVIEIWDSAHGGSAHEFRCEADGFQLIYENTSGELFKPINASRVEFTIFVDNATIEGLYANVITAAENRFLVKITRNGDLFWYGKIVADIGIKEDISRNMRPVYKVVALDGLGLLAQKDYNNNGTAYTGKARLLEHVKNCLAKIGTLGEFTGAADPAIITVVEWHEDNMASGGGDDPFYLTRVAHESFWSSDNKGKKTYRSCLEVLEIICRNFGARIYQANGAWRIEQITERHNASIAEIRYDETGTYLNHASVNYTVNLDQATNSKIVGGEYTYFPPVREVRINFFHENWRNYNEGAVFISEISPAHVSIYNAEIGTGSTFQITANVSQVITYTGTPYTAVFAVFFCEFKVGSRYLKRDIASIFGTSITYGPTEWSTTVSRYYFAFPFQATGSGTQVKNSGIIINTPVLLEGGNPEIRMIFQEFRKMIDGSPTTAGLSQSFNIGNVYTRLLHFGNYQEENIGLLYSVTSTNGLNNSEVIEFDTNIGDEPYPGTINRLEIWNGSAWVASNGWRNGLSGGYVPLLSLCAEEILATMKEPVEKWLGTLKGQFDARHRFGWSSAHYIFIGGTLTARRDEWSGTYVKIAKDKTSISVATPVPLGATPGDGKTPFNPTQTPSTFVDPTNNTTEMNVGGVVGSVMSHVSTLNSVGVGPVTSLTLSNAANAGVFQAGQTVTIVNPFNGATQNLTVTTTNLQGATSLSVSGYSAQAFPEGSYIMVSPQNWTIGNNPGGEDSTWWEVYGQHWSLDDTNAEQWPIEGYDTVLETNINAGNGTTAGIRFDGDGIQAYNASSTTPRFSVATDGRLRALQTTHPTNQAGMIYVLDGILHNDANLEANKTIPQFGHTKHVSVIGYDVDWATTNNWPVLAWSSEYEPYVIYKIYYRMQTAGSNNNQVFIQEYDGTTVNTIATITTAGQTYGEINLSPVFAITANKYIRFIVNAITGTAPKMLFVEFFIRTA